MVALCEPLLQWTVVLLVCFRLLSQRSSISGLRAKTVPRRPNNWPVEQCQNAEKIYYLLFKFHFSVLTIYIFIFIINEILILVKNLKMGKREGGLLGLGAPLSRFLEGAPYKFLNEWMNCAKWILVSIVRVQCNYYNHNVCCKNAPNIKHNRK